MESNNIELITRMVIQAINQNEKKGDGFMVPIGVSARHMEEITEVMSMVSLKHLDAPCILYNLNGYYNSLKQLLDHMIKMGLSSENRQQGIYFADDMEDIKALLPECV